MLFRSAKRSKDLKQQHHLKMADQLRSQLKTSDDKGVTEDSAEDAYRKQSDQAWKNVAAKDKGPIGRFATKLAAKLDGSKVKLGKNKEQGVAKEEVEELDEASPSTYKLGRASAETKSFPIKNKDSEHVGNLEFHVSAGKLQIGRAHV